VTTVARPFAVPARPPLRVVIGPQTRQAPRLSGWLLLAVTVLTAFFLLIYSRIALDRSAFVLAEIEQQMELEEARYWDLRLEGAHLRSPDRITRLARDMDGDGVPRRGPDGGGTRRGPRPRRSRGAVGRSEGVVERTAMIRSLPGER